MNITFRKCDMNDLPMLRATAYQTYSDTFGHLNDPEIMKAYLDKAFNPERLAAEIADAGSTFYFMHTDGQLSGYMKVNECEAQTDINDPDSLEVERIYLLRGFQGIGLGGALLGHAITIADQGGKRYVWLGVWEKNEKAIRFYIKNGFYEAGKHSFFMGDEEQTDFIMRRDLR